MKVWKRLLSLLLILALFAGSFVGGYALFRSGTYTFDPKNLAAFDGESGSYYLQSAPQDIKFQVTTAQGTGAPDYTLTGPSGEPVSARLERVAGDRYAVAPPSEGYTPGERYTLALGENTFFTDENLSYARTLVFTVERPAVEEYTFTDQVVETDQPLVERGEGILPLDGLTAKPGDILFGPNGADGYAVYKVEELLEDGTASVTVPALDEIYEELEVCGTYQFDVDEIAANPDLEVEILQNVKKSSFYSALITAAYAADVPEDGELEVSITPDSEKNTLEVEIKITLKAGQNGLFNIGQLRNHDVTITLKNTLGLQVKANIQGVTDWDVSACLTSSFGWQVEIVRNVMDASTDAALEDLFAQDGVVDNLLDYQKNVKKITEALNRVAADVNGGEIKIFDWKLPVPSVPGLYFSAEVKLFAKFEMTASVSIGQENTTIYTVGICFTDWEFRPYSNTYRSGEDVTLSLRGKASAKAGLKLVIKATVISDKVANINVDPQVGLYADVYVTMPILGAEEALARNFLYGYFEPGVYFSADFNAYLNIVVKEYKFTYQLVEKKFPIEDWTLGDPKIATGITANAASVRAVDNVVSLPEILFEYYDVKDGVSKSEALDYSDLKYVTNEGVSLQAEDGKVTIPSASSGSCYVTATYLHTDGRSYSTIFRVLISGSMLEGKVSAYGEDQTAGALEGAQVQLFGAGGTQAISTQTTDGEGRFAFNVSEGEYRLVISKEGYQTLTSSQRVGADEIKYTEHILLMDNSQTGNGTAGGTLTDALNGRGVSGALIRLRSGWNTTTGPYVEGIEVTTGTSGRYSIPELPVGYYTAEAVKEGYVAGYTNLLVLSEGARENFDFTITPQLAEDEIRVVLTWGSTPSDLDSHLIGLTPENEPFNVYYRNMHYSFDGVEMANLDVDDTSSYGPETITILEDVYGTYIYAVHNYSNRNSTSSTALSFSDAVVKVYMGSAQVAEYRVPTDQVGTYWTVFEIDHSGQIVPINTVSNNKPAA